MPFSRKVLLSFLVFLLLSPGSSHALGSAPGFAGTQLVQSAPIETDYAVPGLPHAKDVWLEMIRSARKSIDLGQMYVANQAGEALEPVLAALEDAGRRKVKIRVLLSKHMWTTDRAALARLQAIRGIEVRAYDLSQLTKGIIHCKYWIIDRREAFVGSQNFDWRALTQIHELGVRLTDSRVVQQLGEIFEIDWKIAQTGRYPFAERSERVAPRQEAEVELVASPSRLNPRSVRYSLTVLRELITQARRTIKIQLLDYATGSKSKPWLEIDQALVAAAGRGVKIDLLVSHWNAGNTDELNSLKRLAHIPGVRVRILTPPLESRGPIPYARVLHSKYMSVDGETLWLGTSNWSEKYFTVTRGVELVLRSDALAQSAEEIFSRLWSQPTIETVNDLTPTRGRGF